VLTVSAERSWQRLEGDRAYFAERVSGPFRRQVRLGEGLDIEGIEADYHDGVLTVRIPVGQQAQPRKIAVKARTELEAETVS
jgi:HSP20 family protein